MIQIAIVHDKHSDDEIFILKFNFTIYLLRFNFKQWTRHWISRRFWPVFVDDSSMVAAVAGAVVGVVVLAVIVGLVVYITKIKK